MKTKRVIALLLAMLVCVVALCSCSSQTNETTPSTSDEIVLPNSPTDGSVPSGSGDENATGLVAGTSDVKVVKGVDEELDAEAVRVISASPKWKAGKMSGNRVRAVLTLPIEFRLEKNSSKSSFGVKGINGKRKK